MELKKILIIPARRHILEAYSEYLMRYLGDEFYFEMGYPSEPPYFNIRQRVWTGQTSPLEKNPDDFDLIYPHFTTHFFLSPPEKYYHKMVLAYLEPGGAHNDIKVLGATSKPCEDSLGQTPHHKLRFGVDTNLFKPFPQVRLDDKVHVGFLGTIQTPRRYMKELFMPLKDLDIKLDIHPTVWYKHTRPDEIESMGGQSVIDNIVSGDKWEAGLPNLYNKMDIYVRCDIDAGCQLSIMQAAACGIPVVHTDPGMGKELADAGGSIYIDPTDRNIERIREEIRKAVIDLKDNPDKRKEIGAKARKFIEENYTWPKLIPAWREFFREGLKYAQM